MWDLLLEGRMLSMGGASLTTTHGVWLSVMEIRREVKDFQKFSGCHRHLDQNFIRQPNTVRTRW